jgi:hypothetical protein
MMETEFDNLVAGLRIKVIDDVVGAFLDKCMAHRFKIDDACFRPIYE